jgi:hypothetical protein
MTLRIYIGMALLLVVFSGCSGQSSYGTNQLRLIKTIPLPGVKDRIDHLDVNLKEGVVI